MFLKPLADAKLKDLWPKRAEALGIRNLIYSLNLVR